MFALVVCVLCGACCMPCISLSLCVFCCVSLCVFFGVYCCASLPPPPPLWKQKAAWRHARRTRLGRTPLGWAAAITATAKPVLCVCARVYLALSYLKVGVVYLPPNLPSSPGGICPPELQGIRQLPRSWASVNPFIFHFY